MRENEIVSSHQRTLEDLNSSLELEVLSRSKAIRAYCIECSGGQPSEVRYCTCWDCQLFPYRFGKKMSKQTVCKGDVISPKKEGSGGL